MRHVTDGELHAYLDGALDHLPNGRGEEVREHLASCPACGERLQDETGVRERSQEILERGAPPEVELPPFEELRVRAEAAEKGAGPNSRGGRDRARVRAPLGSTPLAWAATVVLALGVGWMGGEIWRTLPGEDAREFSGAETDALPSSSSMEDEGPAEVGAVPPESGEVQEEGRMTQERESATEAPSTPPPAAGRAEADERNPTPDGTPTRASGLAAPGVASALGENAPAAAKGTENPAPESPLAQQVLRNRADVSAAPELTDPEGITRDHSLALPGFPVLSVEWEEWVPGERNLHIRQLLPMGDTVELRYLGMLMGTDPGSKPEPGEEARGQGGALLEHPPLPKVMEASLPPGWNQVVMKKGRGWLVARAPLKVEQLRALLRALR